MELPLSLLLSPFNFSPEHTPLCIVSPRQPAVSMAASARDDSALYNSLPAVEQTLGYAFADRRLLLTALTHRSFCNETDTASGDFDELEWLGDSVLQLAVSSWLFRSAEGSRRSSGQLSATRQRFVDAGACESFALKLNLVSHACLNSAAAVRRPLARRATHHPPHRSLPVRRMHKGGRRGVGFFLRR